CYGCVVYWRRRREGARDIYYVTTRRSSDLGRRNGPRRSSARQRPAGTRGKRQVIDNLLLLVQNPSFALDVVLNGLLVGAIFALRSEEHTSEIQSREKLVCRLLIDKKL